MVAVRRRAGAAALGGMAVVLALATACSAPTPVGGEVPSPPTGSPTRATTTTGPPPVPTSTSVPPPATPTLPATDDRGPLPTSIQPVAVGELTRFRVTRDGRTTLDAQSSGLARYNTSDRCEVPGQPCYDAPTLDKVARIDIGAPPTVPGKDTTFVTGHSNRFQPDDAAKGVFSHLQDAQVGDRLVLTTTQGVFVYGVGKAFPVPFDQLTSNPDVVRVQADTVIAISCVIPPDHGPYTGNYVVIATLQASAAS